MNQYEPWTPEEDKILQENAHLKRSELMKLLPGRSKKAIEARAQKTGWLRQVGWERWTKEELTLLSESAHLPDEELLKLLPNRSPSAINHKLFELGVDRRYVTLEADTKHHRPLTDETAYQCRIEYDQKREYGYDHERAVKWVAEANERDIDIVRDLLTNPKYDAQVEECRLKYKKLDVGDLPDMDEVAEMLQRLAEAGTKRNGHGEVPIVGTNIKTGEKVCFPSLKAAEDAGFIASAISQCLRKKHKSHNGYIWERLKDYGID